MARKRKIFAPSEDDITAAIIDHWKLLGVPGSLVASIPNKRAFGQAGLTPGLPDLLVLSPQLGSLTGYIELKVERGRPSKAQTAMRDLMRERGAPYALTHGRDEPIRQLEEWGAVKPSARPNERFVAMGKVGGPARAARLTPERRSEIGRLGAHVARVRARAEQTGEPVPLTRKQRGELARQAALMRSEKSKEAMRLALERLARAAE
jgi:hypothetical protein